MYVTELTEHIATLRKAGTTESLTEALALAEEVLTIRLAHQGPDAGWTTTDGKPAEWYEVSDARRKVQELGFRIELNFESRAELSRAVAAGAEVKELRRQDRYDEALELARTQLGIYRRLLGDEHFRTAGSLGNVAGVLSSKGDYTAAEPFYRESLAKYLQLLGNDHPNVAGTLNNLAVLLKRKGDFAAAEPIYREALAINRRLLGNEHLDVARNLNNLAQFYRVTGDYATAEPLYRESLAIRRKLLGDEDPAVASSLKNLAGLLVLKGDYAAAEPLSREALAIHRRLRGNEHLDVAGSLDTLAMVLRKMGDYAGAEPRYREALAIRRKLLGDEHPLVATSLNNLAVLLTLKGDYDTAESLYREALAINRKRFGEQHSRVATNLSNLAKLAEKKGNYTAAEPLYREALAIRRKLLGNEHPEVAASLSTLAGLLESKGDYSASESLYRNALAIRRKQLGDEHPDVAVSLNNLAILLVKMGDNDTAEPLQREALAINRKLLGEEHVEVAVCLRNLACVLFNKGDFVAAETMQREALAMSQKLLGDLHPVVASHLNTLAVFLERKGDFAAAEPLFREALAMRRELLGDEHPDVVITLNLLAELLYDRGDLPAAERAWTAAAESFEAARKRVGFGGLDRVQFTVLNSPLKSLAVCRAHNGKPLPAWKSLEANLARGLLDTVSTREARPLEKGEQDRERNLIDRLNKLDEQISSLLATAKGSDQIQTRIEKLRKQQEADLAELSQFEAEMVARYGVASGEVYDLSRIQAQLDIDSALLAWVDINGNPRAVDPGGEHWACLVKNHGDPVWINLSGSGRGGTWNNTDDELSGLLREALRQHSRDTSTQQKQNLITRLHAQRLALVEPYLAGIRHLIVLPAGRMAGIPLEALTEDYTVSYAPSGTMYAWLRENQLKQQQLTAAAHPASLLALGDPEFPDPKEADIPSDPPDHGILLATVAPDSNAGLSGLMAGDVLLSYGEKKLEEPTQLGPTIELAQSMADAEDRKDIPVSLWRNGETLELSVSPGRLGVRSAPQPAPEAILTQQRLDKTMASTRGPSFTPLPASRLEVESIAVLFINPYGEQQPTILLGSEASEQRLDALAKSGELAKYRYIHLATHGVMDDRIAMNSAMILSQVNLPDALEQAVEGRVFFDGRLTARQIVRTWKLDADLVTLSGCETALGRKSGGEGYLGFSQALFVAGSRSLLLSLWKVDDRATMLLMTRFYENVRGKYEQDRRTPGREFPAGTPLPKAEALREAKIWLRQLTVDQLRGLELTRRERGPTAATPVSAEAEGSIPFRPYQDPQYWASFILIGNAD